MITENISSNLVFNAKRFDGGFFLNEFAVNSRILELNRDKCNVLFDIANVFNPPIFKRQFCQNTERAVQYCQSSDVTNTLEGSNTYINKKQAEKVRTLVKENQILVTGFGTIGNVRLVNELSDGLSYANNVCRIEVNEDDLYGFVYALFASKYGHSQLNKNASGSVVRYIEAPGIKKTLIPIFPKDKQEEIHELIVDAANLRVEANRLLEEAIGHFDSLNVGYEYGSYSTHTIKSNKFDKNKRLDASYSIVTTKVKDALKKDVKSYVTINELASGIFTYSYKQ